MLSEFLNFINENNLIGKKQRVLAAVSGGIDSMVMADLFIKAGMNVGIAHCNFCLRGNESDKDEALVKKLSAKNNLPFFSVRFDTENYAEENRISIQMAARDLRYRWFEETRKKNGYDLIAVAHNLNDNIETMLINLTRGTGISGLTGMRTSVNHIIRPLLFASRHSIEIYCRKQGIKYREDKSNTGIKYTRNKIRHLVIPVLKEINPSVETTLNETAGRLNEVNEIMNLYISNLAEKVITREDNLLKISIKKIKPFVGNSTIIYELFKPFGITGNNLNDLKSIITSRTGSKVFSTTHRIMRNRDEILITGLPQNKKQVFNLKDLKELRETGLFKSARLTNISQEFIITKESRTAYIDFAKLKFPLSVRSWQSGDSFHPFGMKERKKLSDYLIDSKFSGPEKEKLLILESDGEIVWLLGERLDNRFRITKRTKKALVLKV